MLRLLRLRPHRCDGDARAACLLPNEDKPEIRRVEYDVDRKIEALVDSPRSPRHCIAEMLEAGSYRQP